MKLALHGVVGMLLCLIAAATFADPVSFADLARHARFDAVKISPDGTHIAATTVLADGQKVLSLMNLVTHKGVNIQPRQGDDVMDF
ncbi:MAG TPA: S9 family peptidase, partial [Rhodanobacteraceae bacterium]|nr:S9 family peptidase [Rhodanobacteraceae bacterium]